MKNKKILIIDNSQIKNELKSKLFNDFDFLSCEQNGNTAFMMILKHRPDIILTDLVLSDFDGFTLFEKIKNIKNYNPVIFVYTHFIYDRTIEKCLSYKVDYIFAKPQSADILSQRIKETNYNKTKPVITKSLSQCATDIVISVGVPSHLKGFKYIVDAIILNFNQPDISNKITSELYPSIAKKHKTTSAGVERSIRTAITSLWNRSGEKRVSNLFGVDTFMGVKKPTNSEFICFMSNQLNSFCF